MNAGQLIEWIQDRLPEPSAATVRRLPAREARYGDWPERLDSRIVGALEARGVARPYIHQAAAVRQALAGENVVVVTPTASGKTLCYTLPVLQAILADPEARALYLFPTKALAQDQLAELNDLIARLGVKVAAYTYDGDTPANARRAVRQAGQIVVTNPDMLHSGILPYHTQWHRLFANLTYIVIDEMHVYRGVFGSNVANVIRRLKRICRHYGATPRFILSSASIANPLELAERLIEEPVCAVTESGAPSGEKTIVFYNPPIVNAALGIRTGSVQAARRLAGQAIGNRIHTIVFARSRLIVELLLRYLRDDAQRARLPAEVIQGYRGGYLPNERRKIERGLREGSILGVISTNALELGIDIGSLEVGILVGYPGTGASTWQQIGRVGRRNEPSMAVLVASSAPLDQFIANHPEYLLEGSVEAARINPDNLSILANHVKCAAFELPFADAEAFGATPLAPLLQHLAEARILYHSDERWFWMSESFPAHEVSLRTATTENVVIVDQTVPHAVQLIGEMDRPSAATMLHDEAIYLHAGRQYEVVRLDWEEKKAFVRQVEADYYTDASLAVRVAVLDRFSEADHCAWGEVSVTYLATIYKKIKLETHENVGWGKINLPEDTFHTTACWITFPEGRWGRSEIERGLAGVGHVLGNVAPLFVMADPRDLGVYAETRGVFTGLPTVFLYDAVPGGVGFAERLYGSYEQLIASAAALIADCPCVAGCPSCVGAPIGEDSAKQTARELLESLTVEGGGDNERSAIRSAACCQRLPD